MTLIFNKTMDLNNSQENQLFKTIQKSFFLLEPLDKLLVDLICLNKDFNQEKLILLTMQHHAVIKYPMKTDYAIRFLKMVIGLLESNGIEVLEKIYYEYFNVLNSSENKKYYYRHFMINHDICVIKCTYNLISRGTTGLCIWEGAMVLSEWCLQNKSILKNKVVLELGCGVGLAGLVAIKNCNCKQYIFSDCNYKVLDILQQNVQLNLEDHEILCSSQDCSEISHAFNELVCKISEINIPGDKSKHKEREVITKESSNNTFSFQDTLIAIKNLSFEEISQDHSKDILCDIVLASDVIYDTDLFPSLKNALVHIFKENENCLAIFACKVRNLDTYKSFLSVLEETGKFEVLEQQLIDQDLFFFSDRKMYSLVKLLMIKKSAK